MIARLLGAAAVTATALLLAWAVARTRGRALPRSAWPILTALSLIGYGVYDEYSWESRTRAALPAEVAVAGRGASRSPLAPWSYLVARVDRLSLIDRRRVRTHPDHPSLRLIEIALLERMRPTLLVNEMVDCAAGRAAALGDATEFGPDGLPGGTRWYPLEPDDARLGIVCD